MKNSSSCSHNLDGDKRHQLGHSIGMVGRLWRLEVDRRLAPFGLSEARWRILLTLARAAEPLQQKTLAEYVGVQGPTLVRTLDALANEGLLERRADSDDKRARTIHLTAKAEPTLVRIEATLRAVREEIFTDIAAADIDTCIRVFDQLLTNLSPRTGR